VRSHYQDNCILKCTDVFKLLCKEVPDGSCEPKHVAVCDVTLKFVCWTAYFRLLMTQENTKKFIRIKKEVMQIWVPQKAFKYLARSAKISFSRNTLVP